MLEIKLESARPTYCIVPDPESSPLMTTSCYDLFPLSPWLKKKSDDLPTEMTGESQFPSYWAAKAKTSDLGTTNLQLAQNLFQ